VIHLSPPKSIDQYYRKLAAPGDGKPPTALLRQKKT
jgi:hypothetical protein